MTPITKNINVIDEQGNVYEATYPKRAKGLVKQGRARFINESTLCIACPPDINLEDNIMSDINKPISNGPRPSTIPYLSEEQENESVSLSRVLSSIEKLVCDNSYIVEAVNSIRDISEDDDWVEEKTNAMIAIVRAREETNKEALKVLERLTNCLVGTK